MARQQASSHSAITRGVPSTSTVPEPRARAVSASPTVIVASPRCPVATVTARHANAHQGRGHTADRTRLADPLAGAQPPDPREGAPVA